MKHILQLDPAGLVFLVFFLLTRGGKFVPAENYVKEESPPTGSLFSSEAARICGYPFNLLSRHARRSN